MAYHNVFVHRGNDWAGVKAELTKKIKIALVSTKTPWHQSYVAGTTLKNWFVSVLRIDSTEPLEDIVAKLNNFQPRSLVAYANMAKVLAQEQLAGRLSISPEAVFTSSEVLTGEARKLIYDAWHTQPFNQYASTETAGIASECMRHRLHLYEDLVIAEVVNENYKPVEPHQYGSKLLVTVLFSRTLPLIRYELDDSVLLSYERCLCDKSFATLADIQGRIGEVLYLEKQSGNRVAIQPIFFHKIMESFPVGGWQIIQEKNNLLRVLIVNPAKNFDENSFTKIISNELVKQGATKSVVKVEYVSSLNKTTLGKVVLIKSMG